MSDGRLGRATTCNSCDQAIRWAITKNGKRMPVDATPSDTGNVVLVPRFRGQAPQADVYRNHVEALTGAGEDGETYSSHFVTCPNAARHRRG